MISRTVLATMAAASLASAAWAQEPRVEISGSAAWTFSDGVSGSATDAAGHEFTRIDPKDSFSWNARLGFMVTPSVEIGAMVGVQATSLQVSATGLGDLKLGDETLYNYHGYLAYNFGESEKVKPYVLLGLGATQFGGVNVNALGQQRTIGGNTKFSTTWSLGVKVYPSRNVGLRLEGRWTPTYIKTDAEGWWCDPYWGCYTYGNAQYANQWEMGGGIVLRF